MLRSHRVCLLLALASLAPALVQAEPPQVIVEGLPAELRRNVELLLSIEQRKADPGLTEEHLRTLYEQGPREIRRALEAFGHYRPQIRGDLQRKDDRWVARYVIDPGPALRLTTLDLRIIGAGTADPEFDKLATTLPLREREPLRHANYEQAKRALLQLAAERGYFDAHLVRSELRIDLARYTAIAELHLDTGSRYRFGEVRFEQSFFDPDFLARFVTFRSGEPYSNSALVQLQTTLSNSDYFQQVDVLPRRDLARDLEVPIDVALALRAPNKYTFGVGYGTDTGARGTLGWERRLITRDGHRFAAELDISEVTSTANARYLIPVLDPRTDFAALNASTIDDETVTSTSRRSILGVGLNRSRGNWRETLALNYHHENFTAGSDSGTATLTIPTAIWAYIRADNRINPRHGGRAQFDLRGANEELGSDLSFWQARIAGKYIFPVAGFGRIVTRAEGGYTRTERFRELPASLRFYTGGSQSVRGYPYQGLGATDETGQIIGGRYLLVGSVEYEQRLWRSLGAAVFYDKGKAFNDDSEPFSEGAGVGLRLHLPLGLAQLDVAQAMTRDNRPWRVHFVIGAEL